MSVKQPDDFSGSLDDEQVRRRFDELISLNPELNVPVNSGAGPRDWQIEEDEGAFVPPEVSSARPRTLRTWLQVLSISFSILLLVILGLTRPANSAVWAVAALVILATALLTVFNSLPHRRDPDDPDAL